MTDDVLRVAALLVTCLLGLWTAVACRRTHYHGGEIDHANAGERSRPRVSP